MGIVAIINKQTTTTMTNNMKGNGNPKSHNIIPVTILCGTEEIGGQQALLELFRRSKPVDDTCIALLPSLNYDDDDEHTTVSDFEIYSSKEDQMVSLKGTTKNEDRSTSLRQRLMGDFALLVDASVDALLLLSVNTKTSIQIMQLFYNTTDKDFHQNYSLDSVVALINAQNFLKELQERNKAEAEAWMRKNHQIQLADTLLLHHPTSVVKEQVGGGDAGMSVLETFLQRMNPMAKIQRLDKISIQTVLNQQAFELDNLGKSLNDILSVEGRRVGSSLAHSSESSSTTTQQRQQQENRQYYSVCLLLPGELHIDLLSSWLNKLTSELHVDLGRYKCVFAVKGREEKYIFHGVSNEWSGDYSKNLRWNHELRQSQIVITGYNKSNLNAEYIAKGFASCVVKGELRFAVGDAVQAFTGRWMDGHIIGLWDEGNAYRIRLKKSGEDVWAVHDKDSLVRKKPKRQYGNKKKQQKQRSRNTCKQLNRARG